MLYHVNKTTLYDIIHELLLSFTLKKKTYKTLHGIYYYNDTFSYNKFSVRRSCSLTQGCELGYLILILICKKRRKFYINLTTVKHKTLVGSSSSWNIVNNVYMLSTRASFQICNS